MQEITRNIPLQQAPGHLRAPREAEEPARISVPEESYVGNVDIYLPRDLPLPEALSSQKRALEDDRGGSGLGAFKKAALIGLAGLSLFGGVLAATPALAGEVKPAPEIGISATLPEETKVASTQTGKGEFLIAQNANVGTMEEAKKNVNPSTAEIKKMLEAAAEKHGVPKNIVFAIGWHESGWHHFEDDGSVVRGVNRGRKGKILSCDWGIMQINDKWHLEAFPRAKEYVSYCTS